MFNHYHYLYVEDDPLSREIMEMIMGMVMGVETLTILESSHDFLACVKSQVYKADVFLLDIHVKPHDGFEMLAMLRADPAHRNARIIALTASVMNEEVERLRASGFDGAIAKPISVQTFPALLERVIKGEAIWYVA